MRIVALHLDDGADEIATLAFEVHGLRLYGWRVVRAAEGGAQLLPPTWMHASGLDTDLRDAVLADALAAIAALTSINLQHGEASP